MTSVVVISIWNGFAPAAIAWIGKAILDSIPTNFDVQLRLTTRELVTVEAALVASTAIAARINSFSLELLRFAVNERTAEGILDAGLRLSLGQFENPETYNLIENARKEAATRPLAASLSLISLVQGLVTLFVFTAMLWRVAWWAALILALAPIPSFFAEAWTSQRYFQIQSNRAPTVRFLNYIETILLQAGFAKEVKVFSLGGQLRGKYMANLRDLHAEIRRYARSRIGTLSVFSVVTISAYYACFVYVVSRTILGELSVGSLVMYAGMFRQSQAGMGAMLTEIASINESAMYLTNLFAFLDSNKSKVGSDSFRGFPNSSIDLVDVSFRYGSGPWVLRDVSLSIAPGEFVAFVGGNGAGKSSLLKLLCGFYPPDKGKISIGGVDISRCDPECVRSSISAVFQDHVRYQFTVKENVALGEALSTELSDLQRALEATGSCSFVDVLPRGWDSMLGQWFEGASDLSGGQWQRLAIARALTKRNAPIVVLDEPTSALDSQSEAAFLRTLKRLSGQTTVVLVSHRLSTVMNADRIVVLKDGGVDAIGSHESLLEVCESYKQMFGDQLPVSEDAASEPAKFVADAPPRV